MCFTRRSLIQVLTQHVAVSRKPEGLEQQEWPEGPERLEEPERSEQPERPKVTRVTKVTKCVFALTSPDTT